MQARAARPRARGMRAWLAAADNAPFDVAAPGCTFRARFGGARRAHGLGTGLCHERQCVATTCAGPAVADGRFRVVVYA